MQSLQIRPKWNSKRQNFQISFAVLLKKTIDKINGP